MAAAEPFHRMTLRTFQRFGAAATISLDILAAASDDNTVSGGTFKAILDEDMKTAGFGDGWQQHVEPHDEIEVLQADFASKPGTDHAITLNGIEYAIVRPVKDDGVVWRYEVNASV